MRVCLTAELVAAASDVRRGPRFSGVPFHARVPLTGIELTVYLNRMNMGDQSRLPVLDLSPSISTNWITTSQSIGSIDFVG